MREIIKYLSEDGYEFSTETKCRNHEKLCAKVARIMKLLPEKPELNSEQYIQHIASDFRLVRLELLNLAKDYTKLDWIQQSIDDPTVHSSWAGRAINECGVPPLDRAWGRIMCTDSYFREWNQPFYANNTPANFERVLTK